MISERLSMEDRVMLSIALDSRPRTVSILCSKMMRFVKDVEVNVNVKVWEGELLYKSTWKSTADVDVNLDLEEDMPPFYFEMSIKGKDTPQVMNIWKMVESGMRSGPVNVALRLRRVIERNMRTRSKLHVVKMLVMPESHYQILNNKISLKAKRRQLLRKYNSKRYVDHLIRLTHTEVTTLVYDNSWEGNLGSL
jgi:hypothetical protein